MILLIIFYIFIILISIIFRFIGINNKNSVNDKINGKIILEFIDNSIVNEDNVNYLDLEFVLKKYKIINNNILEKCFKKIERYDFIIENQKIKLRNYTLKAKIGIRDAKRIANNQIKLKENEYRKIIVELLKIDKNNFINYLLINIKYNKEKIRK